MTDGDQPATTEFESEVRDFVRRDFYLHRRPQHDIARETGVNNVNLLVARSAGESVAEIERVIEQLQAMRDMLREEGDRVQREIMSYGDVSQGRIASLKLIAEDLARCRSIRPEGG